MARVDRIATLMSIQPSLRVRTGLGTWWRYGTAGGSHRSRHGTRWSGPMAGGADCTLDGLSTPEGVLSVHRFVPPVGDYRLSRTGAPVPRQSPDLCRFAYVKGSAAAKAAIRALQGAGAGASGGLAGDVGAIYPSIRGSAASGPTPLPCPPSKRRRA